MKDKERWLTRVVAEKQLGVTAQQFVNLRRDGKIKPYPLSGFKRPVYHPREIADLKTQLERELAPKS